VRLAAPFVSGFDAYCVELLARLRVEAQFTIQFVTPGSARALIGYLSSPKAMWVIRSHGLNPDGGHPRSPAARQQGRHQGAPRARRFVHGDLSPDAVAKRQQVSNS
jgi:hypothetical protein